MSTHALERSFRHRFLASVTTVVLLSGLASCASQQSQSNNLAVASSNTGGNSTEAKTLVLRVGFISSESKLPIGPEGWTLQKGTLTPALKSLGVTEVKFIPFVGGPALNEALVSGQLDMGLYGDTPALVGRAAGLPTRLINQTRVGQNAWLITKKNGVRSVAQLKGTKIGVAKGTYPHRYLMGLLEKEGLTKDVKVVQIPAADAKPALERGDISAYPFAMGAGPTLVSQGFPAIDRAKDHQGLVGTGVSVVTENFLSRHPELPQKWNQIRRQALQEIKANPEAFYQFAAQASGNVPLAIVKESYPLDLYPTEPFTPEGLKLLNSTKQFLADQKLLKSDFEIKDWQISNP
ncbi:ABC transporter substrate-binding protein [Nostocaceae cyanobacterium CENA369]|uniref:ABC transporter substrate-binding protein n=1 Tax=Dendronalium phyllosphericum CENA369 TaxID=1725256 RepID=A0A8J7LCX0_9NOST|nr:ABC transporter substrate-binding protein [Dendronalium phyllosphericum]MBH8572426.1 ABC transporter substrate-binding protein [Dendronalium phyllosphericum CENA369]